MFQFLLLLQLFAFVASRSRYALDEEIFSDWFEMNDPNLNPGFDLDAWRDAQLDLHNYYRSLHGAPPMTRNETLTNHAQQYAETLAARNGGLVHCTPAVNCDRYGAGENLAVAFGSTSVESNATKEWYDEIWDYNFCFDANDSTPTRPGHAGKAIGHFTQVVWEDSTQLGVGYARNARRDKVYVVARYLNHGNVGSLYSDNVKVPSYILDTFQNNCDGTTGNLTDWMGPGPCTRSCGGGVRLLTKTCTSPKPSLNGADCLGTTAKLAAREWCNNYTCPGNEHHRDLQCAARGFTRRRHFSQGPNDCNLKCFLPTGNVYLDAGNVDDGTHCNSAAGTCLNGACVDMPQYVPGDPPTPAPPTTPDITTTGPTTETEMTTTMVPVKNATEPTTEPKNTTLPPTPPTPAPPTPTSANVTTSKPTTEPETTTVKPTTISTTSRPSPSPRRRIVRGRLLVRIRPGRRSGILLTLTTGRYRLSLLTLARVRTIYVSRLKRVGAGNKRGGWRRIRCRSSRCRIRALSVPPGYQREFAVYIPRSYCRRGRRCRRPIRMFLFYAYLRY